jgi:hypothetical protein
MIEAWSGNVLVKQALMGDGCKGHVPLTLPRFEVRVRLSLPLAVAPGCVPPALAVLEPDGETAPGCWNWAAR